MCQSEGLTYQKGPREGLYGGLVHVAVDGGASKKCFKYFLNKSKGNRVFYLTTGTRAWNDATTEKTAPTSKGPTLLVRRDLHREEKWLKKRFPNAVFPHIYLHIVVPAVDRNEMAPPRYRIQSWNKKIYIFLKLANLLCTSCANAIMKQSTMDPMTPQNAMVASCQPRSVRKGTATY